jgi:hypothetical protein
MTQSVTDCTGLHVDPEYPALALSDCRKIGTNCMVLYCTKPPLLVRVLGTSWDSQPLKGCMAASASGNIVAGLRNQIRLVGVYGQLVGLRFPL